MQIARELIRFLKDPKIIETQPFSLNAVKEVGKLFLFDLALTFFIGVAILLPINLFFKVDFPERDLNYLELLFYAVVLAPLIEEFIFRFWLKAKKMLTFLFLIFSVICLLYFSFRTYTFWPVTSMIIFFSFIFFLLNYTRINKSAKAQKFYLKNYWVWFYLSAITFGLIHGFNFKLEDKFYLVIPLTLSQTVSGLIYGFARLKFGMWANMSMHAAFNFILISLAAIIPH